MSDILLREDNEGLCTLTLNRPDKLNALNTALFRRIDEELALLEGQTESVGCVVLKAAGSTFCSGADLGAMADEPPPPPTFKPGVIERLSSLPQPVIAVVQGACVTGGLELILAADIILCADTARFADTHGKWGLVGGWGMSQRLPRRVGYANAKLMMMTGRFVGAEDALRTGLVDICCSEQRLHEEANALVSDILANSWHTNRATKRLMQDTEGMRLREGLAHEHYRYPGLAPDYRERIAAFSKKK